MAFTIECLEPRVIPVVLWGWRINDPIPPVQPGGTPVSAWEKVHWPSPFYVLEGGQLNGPTVDFAVTDPRLQSAVVKTLNEYATNIPITFKQVSAIPMDWANPQHTSWYSHGTQASILFSLGDTGLSSILGLGWAPNPQFQQDQIMLNQTIDWFNQPSDLLEGTLLHEEGHDLGLDHNPRNHSVMNPIDGATSIQQADVWGVQSLYGIGVGKVIPLA